MNHQDLGRFFDSVIESFDGEYSFFGFASDGNELKALVDVASTDKIEDNTLFSDILSNMIVSELKEEGVTFITNSVFDCVAALLRYGCISGNNVYEEKFAESLSKMGIDAKFLGK